MRNSILSGLLVLLLLCRCTELIEELNPGDLILTTGACMPDAGDKYAYPVVPGMEEWAKFQTYDEMVEACQLPGNTLKKMSTSGLIQSFLDMPLLMSEIGATGLITVFSVDNMNRVYPRYNSAREFLSHKDAGQVLFTYFEAICFDCLTGQEAVNRMEFDDQVKEAMKQYDFITRLATVQVFFVRPEILEQYNYTDKQRAVAILLSKYERIQELDIDGIHDPAAAEVMTHVMLNAQYPPVMAYFVDDESIEVYGNNLDDVLSFARNFIQ